MTASARKISTPELRGRFKPYPKYKDFGVTWLGKIPAGWEVKKVKHLFEIKKRICGVVGYDVLSITQQGIKVKDIESGDGQLSMDYSKYQIVEVGDFAMNHMDLLTGYVDIAHEFGVTSPDYRVFSLRDKENYFDKYYLYLFQMGYRNKIFYALGQGASQLGRWRFPTDQFNGFDVPSPSLQEQKQIVTFLDRETARVNTLIEKQRQLIYFLKEKRQALIAHTVTKGLNPGVTMKDSSVPWLGKVPKAWEILLFKYISRIAYGDALAEDKRVEGKVPVFGSNGIVGTHNTPNTLSPTIIIGRKGSFGKIVFSSSESFCIDTAYYIDDRHTKADLRWLYYLMITMKLDTISQDTGVPGLSREKVYEEKVPRPSIAEQLAIASFLDRETARIDAAIKKSQTAISLLQEHHAALITSAVTGKIDVREHLGAPVRSVQPAFKRGVFAAEVIRFGQADSCLGRVKLQKSLHLAGHYLDIEELQEDHFKQAAGPYAPGMIRSIEKILSDNKWYAANTDNKGTRYQPMQKVGGHSQYFSNYFGDKSEQINALLNLLKPLNTERCEIVDTLYAAWNDLLLEGKQPADGEIIQAVHDWHDRKKRFSVERLQNALDWMRTKQLTPRGTGKPTRVAKQKKL